MHLISPEEFQRRGNARPTWHVSVARFAGSVTWEDFRASPDARVVKLRRELRPDGTVKHYGAAA